MCKEKSLREVAKVIRSSFFNDPDFPRADVVSAKPLDWVKGHGVNLRIAPGTKIRGMEVTADYGTVLEVGEKHHVLGTTVIDIDGMGPRNIVVSNSQKIYRTGRN